MLAEKVREKLNNHHLGNREVIRFIHFKNTGEDFSAIRLAKEQLDRMGFTHGSMCEDEPIAFAKEFMYVAKWKKIATSEYDKIDGVILPLDNFREGDAIILFLSK